jgi:CheY-like chemotaxis protein
MLMSDHNDNIIVIDDDKSIHKIFEVVARKYFDQEIISYYNGLDAISEMKLALPSLIFIDYNLGDMQGDEILVKINLNDDLHSIIMISANDLDIKANNVSVLKKPITPVKIKELITNFKSKHEPK